MENEIGVYLEIIHFFEDQKQDSREQHLFLVQLMERLESFYNEEIISNALNLTTYFLGERGRELSDCEPDINISELTGNKKQLFLSLLMQEFSPQNENVRLP